MTTIIFEPITIDNVDVETGGREENGKMSLANFPIPWKGKANVGKNTNKVSPETLETLGKSFEIKHGDDFVFDTSIEQQK